MLGRLQGELAQRLRRAEEDGHAARHEHHEARREGAQQEDVTRGADCTAKWTLLLQCDAFDAMCLAFDASPSR